MSLVILGGCGKQAERILLRAGEEIHRQSYVRVNIESYERIGDRVESAGDETLVLLGPAQRVRIDTRAKCLVCEGEKGEWIDRIGDSRSSQVFEIDGCNAVIALGMVAKEPVLGYARLLGAEWWREVYGHDAVVTMHASEMLDGRACYVLSVRTRAKRNEADWWWIEKRRGVFVKYERVAPSEFNRSTSVTGVRYQLISFPVSVDDGEFRIRQSIGAAGAASNISRLQ